jgi:integrase
MLLSGHVDGDQVPVAEVGQLTGFNLPAGWVAEVLAELGLLDDPRGPAIRRWITSRVAEVPAGFAADVRDWLTWLHTGDARTRPRADATIYSYFSHVRPYLDEWGRTHSHLREITTTGITTGLDKLDGRRHHNILTAIKSLFRYCRKTRRIFTDPAARLRSQRVRDGNLLPLDQATVETATSIAATAALRLIFALAAIHAARPHAIRHLALEDLDLPNGRITLNGHTRPLGDLTARALAGYLAERRQRYPHTANPHVLISRRTAGRASPVSAPYLKQYLLQHGIRLEDIRVDRVLGEALAVGPDPLHLSLIFGLSPATAIRYAEAARRILEENHPHQGH